MHIIFLLKIFCIKPPLCPAMHAVPYAGHAGEEGAFVLRTFSSSAVEVEQLPSPLSLVSSWGANCNLVTS